MLGLNHVFPKLSNHLPSYLGAKFLRLSSLLLSKSFNLPLLTFNLRALRNSYRT